MSDSDDALDRELDESKRMYAHDDTPPNALDEHIRAAARRAPHLQMSAPSRWRQPRWVTGFATAAVLVVSVSVFLSSAPGSDTPLLEAAPASTEMRQLPKPASADAGRARTSSTITAKEKLDSPVFQYSGSAAAERIEPMAAPAIPSELDDEMAGEATDSAIEEVIVTGAYTRRLQAEADVQLRSASVEEASKIEIPLDGCEPFTLPADSVLPEPAEADPAGDTVIVQRHEATHTLSCVDGKVQVHPPFEE